jgi:pyrroline-5-carboxylate reductase
MDECELVVIGGGNMGAALLAGLLDADVASPAAVCVVEVAAARRDELGIRFPDVRVAASVPSCRAAVLAVKPAQTPDAAAAAVVAGARRLLSIAAGVRLATLESAAGDAAVVRAMPNTPALVGLGTSAIAPGSRAGADDIAWAQSILGAVGTVDVLPEADLDAFTGVFGSGPAYLFRVAEALVDAAVTNGLDRELAERIVPQLFLGSATLLARDGDPATLRANVTSPGGTTAAGLAELDRRGIVEAFIAATRSATARSVELG